MQGGRRPGWKRGGARRDGRARLWADFFSFATMPATSRRTAVFTESLIREMSRVSKPGRRVYSKIAELQRIYAGLGISILSTPKGVMSDHEARTANVGGEVLCRVF